MVRFNAALCVGALLAACSQGSPATVGRQVAYTPPVDVDPATVLPRNDAGTYNVGGSELLQLRWAPPTPGPMTAASACSRWISGCVSPPTRTVDDCVHSVPACKTGEPWKEPTCCPSACKQRYAVERKKGTGDVDAVMSVFFGDDPCFVGIKALLQ